MLIGSGQNTHVHRSLNFASQAAQLVVFKHAQQLGLSADGHLANLIQQQSALFRQLKASCTALHGPGEGALFVAKNLALNQCLGDGRAVNGHERLGLARTQIMNATRHQLFSRAALTGNQHRSGTGRNHLDQAENFLH